MANPALLLVLGDSRPTLLFGLPCGGRCHIAVSMLSTRIMMMGRRVARSVAGSNRSGQLLDFVPNPLSIVSFQSIMGRVEKVSLGPEVSRDDSLHLEKVL